MCTLFYAFRQTVIQEGCYPAYEFNDLALQPIDCKWHGSEYEYIRNPRVARQLITGVQGECTGECTVHSSKGSSTLSCTVCPRRTRMARR